MEEYNYIRKSNVKKRKVSSNRKHKNNKSSRGVKRKQNRRTRKINDSIT